MMHPHVHFTAFEYSQDLIKIGMDQAILRNPSNLSFRQGDWFKIKEKKMFLMGVLVFKHYLDCQIYTNRCYKSLTNYLQDGLL